MPMQGWKWVLNPRPYNHGCNSLTTQRATLQLPLDLLYGEQTLKGLLPKKRHVYCQTSVVSSPGSLFYTTDVSLSTLFVFCSFLGRAILVKMELWTLNSNSNTTVYDTKVTVSFTHAHNHSDSYNFILKTSQVILQSHFEIFCLFFIRNYLLIWLIHMQTLYRSKLFKIFNGCLATVQK